MATFQQLDYPSWIKSPKTWDNPSLGDFELPGIVHLKPIKKMLRIEDNKSSGKDGVDRLSKGSINQTLQLSFCSIQGHKSNNGPKWFKLSCQQKIPRIVLLSTCVIQRWLVCKCITALLLESKKLLQSLEDR